MADCTPNVSSFQSISSTLDVSEKYKQLMQDSLSDESIYTRAKETMLSLFDGLTLTDVERANLAATHITQLSITLTSKAMETALAWSNLESKNAYELAKIKAETEVLNAEKEKRKFEICLTEKSIDKVIAEATAVTNGSVADVALKQEQTKQVKASEYQILSDAYRKSGHVVISTDADGYTKGTSTYGSYGGYTDQQIKNAQRQLEAYDDSMRNHAANSAATVIGHLLASETLSTSNEQDVARWRMAIDYLNNGSPQ